MKAACNQTIGFTHATNENAIASGIKANATVSHESISDFNWDLFLNSSKNHFLFKYQSNNIYV